MGDGDLECTGDPSGLLAGVAVGVKLLSHEGVFSTEAVAASMPRSFNSLASPNVIENVEHELRRLRPRGVLGAVDCLLFVAPVHTLLPTKL